MARMIEINLHPDVRTLRQFGWIALVGFGAVAAFAHFEILIFAIGLGDVGPYVVRLFVGLAVYAGGFGILYPRANLPIYVGLTVLTCPIGYVFSYAVLGALFFGIITPTGLIMRLIGRDPLERRFDSESETYWKDCHPPRDRSSYFRQF